MFNEKFSKQKYPIFNLNIINCSDLSENELAHNSLKSMTFFYSKKVKTAYLLEQKTKLLKMGDHDTLSLTIRQ